MNDLLQVSYRCCLKLRFASAITPTYLMASLKVMLESKANIVSHTPLYEEKRFRGLGWNRKIELPDTKTMHYTFSWVHYQCCNITPFHSNNCQEKSPDSWDYQLFVSQLYIWYKFDELNTFHIFIKKSYFPKSLPSSFSFLQHHLWQIENASTQTGDG